ncbi:trigger factor [Thauera aromatica]|uniref:trigger factor n=1 Tax=Thauera aromatica TaxID=59405 RepID=UPI001FFD6A62|nr:trigger factor [Thauera aromatica]MCK2088520.1 trigger factor [Thauera aromatica]
MEQNQETPSALERRIDIAVSLADIEKEVDDRLKRIARTVKMAGFRPGKVPMKIVAQTHGGQARGEAVGAAVEKAFGDKVRAENLRVAGYPQIQPKEAATEGTLEFTAVFEVYPEVVVGDLAGQKIERPVLSVGEAEVDQTIDVLRKQRTTFTAVDRAAAEGDRVVIDFTGRKDGEVFDGGQAQDFPFVIGAGSMLKEFEGAVAGLKAGDSKTFDMTFPEDYHAQHLAGQAVQFEVTLKAVEEAVLPTVDGDFAKALGVADGDVSKLREEVKANLEREVKRRIQSRVKEQVMEALLAATPIEVPKALVQAESEQLANSARRDLEMRGLKTKDISVEPAWFADQAVRRVKLGLIMAELVKANELHAKPEQVRALVEEMAQSYEDPSELMRWYYSEPERLAQAEAVVIEDNVVAWVSTKADTTDKDVAFDELMGNNAA